MSEEAAETTEASGSTSTDVKPLKRKYNKGGPQSDKKPPMPVYCKYNILKMLKENHCLISDEGQLQAKAFPRNSRYTLDDIKSREKNSKFLRLDFIAPFSIDRFHQQNGPKVTDYRREK